MKQVFLSMLSLPLSLSLLAQDAKPLPRIEHDTLFTTSGFTVKVGDTLHFGTGTNTTNGSFVNIVRYEGSFGSMFPHPPGPPPGGPSGPPGPPGFPGPGESTNALPSSWNGKKAIVIKLWEKGPKHSLHVFYAIFVGANGSKYQADMDNGISTGEIIVPEKFSPKKGITVAPATAPVSGSVADELAKLKKLKDDGVITQAEFDTQKKKILEKN
jgi:hypothetical protein